MYTARSYNDPYETSVLRNLGSRISPILIPPNFPFSARCTLNFNKTSEKHSLSLPVWAKIHYVLSAIYTAT